MKFVVIDASVAVKWYVAEDESERAVALLDADEILFLAPDYFSGRGDQRAPAAEPGRSVDRGQLG
jgi:hypothetical protein